MKIERLYAITVYLLNHGRTSANALAKYFEVSSRIIQRDIDSLCLSGIPIIAVSGAAGGYEICEQFKLDKHLATPSKKRLPHLQAYTDERPENDGQAFFEGT